MANSPGPSSSNNTNKEMQNNSENEEKKKKRIRRKPRPRNNKILKDVPVSINKMETTTTKLNFNINFKITPIREQLGIVYKQRHHLLGPINLQSFIKNGHVPCVFQTDTDHDLLEKIGKLALKNGLSIHKTDVDLQRKPTTNKKKKKKQQTFGNYINLKQVNKGLASGIYVKGYIRINPKNFKEAYVGNEDTSKTDYIITSVLDRNKALDGDEVILKFKQADNNDNKKIMEVVYITQKIHPRISIGYLTPMKKNQDFALFMPRDKRIPKVKIPKINWPSSFQSQPSLYDDILFVVKIIEWKEESYALGTIIDNLGLSGDLKVESLAILRELCLDPTPYTNNIQQFLPKSSEIPTEEFSYREDLRSECIFTIDPLTARDLDDAISCKELSNGNFLVGVHISDASFYLKENTKLDELVKRKATTIYMVDNVYHMLPTELCLHCSLLPGQDKLSFSVIWEMNANGEILNQRITRSVINSCTQLAYEHAQIMIDQPTRKLSLDDLPTIYNGYKVEDLSKIVNNLQMIAVCLREKRKLNGALKIDQVKISFSLDPQTGKPLKFFIYENKAAHRLIEEFMLLANMTIAQHVYDAYPDLAFLRMHEPPKSTMMNELQKNLETVGIHIDISSSGGIQSSLNKYFTDDYLGRIRMIVLNHLLAKPMQRAKYFCAGTLNEDTIFKHFALSIPIYTHFTSPIRRYADIMIHRLLAASLNYCDKPNWQPEEVATIAETCNRQKYLAKKAGEASSDLYLAHYIESHQPYIQEAVVVDTKDRSIDVIILNTGSVVRIYTNNFGENVSWRSEEIQVDRETNEDVKKMWRIYVHFPKNDTENEANIVLEIFSPVRVELSRKVKTNKLEGKLLRPLPTANLLNS